MKPTSLIIGQHRAVTANASLPPVAGRARSNAMSAGTAAIGQMKQNQASALQHLRHTGPSTLHAGGTPALGHIKASGSLTGDPAPNPLARPGRPVVHVSPRTPVAKQAFIGPLPEPQRAARAPVTLPEAHKIDIIDLPAPQHAVRTLHIDQMPVAHQAIRVQDIDLHSSTRVQTLTIDTNVELAQAKLNSNSTEPVDPKADLARARLDPG